MTEVRSGLKGVRDRSSGETVGIALSWLRLGWGMKARGDERDVLKGEHQA